MPEKMLENVFYSFYFPLLFLGTKQSVSLTKKNSSSKFVFLKNIIQDIHINKLHIDLITPNERVTLLKSCPKEPRVISMFIVSN